MSDARPPDNLSDRLFRQRPDRTARALLVFHVVAWTLVPWAVNDALPLDTIEALAWGREWELGYSKHPPLSAWAAEIAGWFAGGADVGLYALSALCTAVGLAVVWRLTRELLGSQRALLALVLSEGVIYHGFTSPEFNVNVLQIPLWAGAMLGYWRGLRTGRLGWWALLGVCMGLALLSKYLAGALLVAMAVDTLKRERRVLATAGPYVAGALCIALFAPHASWTVENEFVSLTYGVRRAGGGEHEWLNHAVYPAKFLVAQLAAIGALVWLLLVWKPARRAAGDEEARPRLFLLTMTLGPIGALVVLSLATGFELRSMWATPMLLTLGPCAMACLSVRFPEIKKIDGLVWACVIVMAPVLAYAGTSALTMRFRDKPKRVNYPGAAIGAEVTRLWRERVSGPLPIVVGTEWDAGLIGWYSPDRPSVYIHGDPVHAQWLDDDDVHEGGGLIVWVKSTQADEAADEWAAMPFERARFGGEALGDVVVGYPSAPDKAGVRFGVWFVPPAGG